MKFDFYHHGSDIACGDTIGRLPILDWDGWYAKKMFEYRHKGPRQNGFTGKFNSTLYASLVLFRYKFCLRVDFSFGQTTTELAYREYHDRIKARRNKE